MEKINYELAKKLYDAGIVIESEEPYKMWTTATTYSATPAPNAEEVIEFLRKSINLDIGVRRGFIVIKSKDNIEKIGYTLLKALEATLEYLLDDGHIGKQNNNG